MRCGTIVKMIVLLAGTRISQKVFCIDISDGSRSRVGGRGSGKKNGAVGK
jgi:hypothetical protein